MKKLLGAFISLLFVSIFISTASATSSLWDWAFYIDGTIYEYTQGDSMPVTGALDGEGLGTLSWQTSAVGSHTFIAFFDHEIDEAINTYFNEYGEAINTPNAIQSWEIDEPGYVFGDIYTHVTGWDGFGYDPSLIGLDNTNSIPMGFEDDVSWALGWDFTLTSGQTAIISLALADTAPLSGFYLAQTDPDSSETIYFSSTLDIEGGGPTPIPEPGTITLLFFGLVGLIGLKGWPLKS